MDAEASVEGSPGESARWQNDCALKSPPVKVSAPGTQSGGDPGGMYEPVISPHWNQVL
jgi:hypothetical protein